MGEMADFFESEDERKAALEEVTSEGNPYEHEEPGYGTGCLHCAFEEGRAYEREQAAKRDAEKAREDAYYDKLKEG